MNGILNVYKEAGYTSHDVVAKLRGILKQKKIGHTGTLDPDAKGVLPVCLGTATKLCSMLTDSTKVYEAEMLLGITTDTQDISGKIIKNSDILATPAQVEEIIMSFVGKYSQTPPMYSAKKVKGKKLYEYARAGKQVDVKPVEVEIYNISILKMKLPKVRFSVECSKGTYIRTLCHDIGIKAGCGACMTSLLRTRTSGFDISGASTIGELEKAAGDGSIGKLLIPVDFVFSSLPKKTVKNGHSVPLYNGNRIQTAFFTDGEPAGARIRIYDEKEQFIGIYTWDETRKDYKPEKIFWRNEA